MKSIYIVTLVK